MPLIDDLCDLWFYVFCFQLVYKVTQFNISFAVEPLHFSPLFQLVSFHLQGFLSHFHVTYERT